MNLSHTLPPDTHPLPLAARLLLQQLQQTRHGAIQLITPQGDVMLFGQPQASPSCQLHINDWRACNLIVRSGDIGFADALRQGWLDSPDLTALLNWVLDNEATLGNRLGGNWLSQCWYRLRHALQRNSKGGSRKNIHDHYDLGNDFYRLWLDSSWTYSSAWFAGNNQQSLESAQAAKYQRICDVLQLKPGMQVLEIGCGWGGFMEHATAQGIAVRGITLSHEQLTFARQRLAHQPLASLALCDYRDLTGRYDAIVSIEMFEAVGEAYWPGYMATLQRCLKPGGKALIQSITIADKLFEQYRLRSDFIQTYIFPGGMLPSVERFQKLCQQHDMAITNQLDFGRDYAETLRRWRDSFEQHLGTIRQQFDESFIRLWRLYLCYCEAGFDHDRIGVSQFMLERS